jgi:hypothetical protein
MTPTTEKARPSLQLANHHEARSLDSSRASSVLGRRIHIHGVELGSERAELHEAAGLGPLTSEAIYDPATGHVTKLDDSVISLFAKGATDET